jgi:hypothetical protein
MARLFWSLIAAAAFSDPMARSTYSYSPTETTTEIFGRTVSLSWETDRSLLIAAAVFAVVGVVGYVTAARWR